MRRRYFFLALAAGIAHATVARSQSAPLVRVAWVSTERANARSPFLAAFRGGMRELGYIEGRNLVLDTWWGDGSEDRLAAQIDAIVRSQPTVIVAQGGLALNPLLKAHVSIPIVFGVSVEPVEAGIVQSFNHPGGNATGMTFFALDLVGKRMQIIKETLPKITSIAVLADPQHPGQHKELATVQQAASDLGLRARYFPVHSEAELEAALSDVARAHHDAILAFADGFTQSFAGRIARFSAQQRIPAFDGWSSFARQGNLLIYGPVLEDCYRRLAAYADKIVRGARPGDLPIELPTQVELVINLKTARALGITIPQSLLLRADALIE